MLRKLCFANDKRMKKLVNPGVNSFCTLRLHLFKRREMTGTWFAKFTTLLHFPFVDGRSSYCEGKYLIISGKKK